MLYSMFHASNQVSKPFNQMLGVWTDLLSHSMNPFGQTPVGRYLRAATELPHRMTRDYDKVEYNIGLVHDDLGDMVIEEHIVCSKPFCDLLRFQDLEADGERPKVMIIAALSGHYATLLRDTVGRFIHDYDVYVTDWKNARDVPLGQGDFGFEEYVSYIIDFQEELGRGTHIVAICQSTVQALIATAVLSEKNPELVPPTLTLMAGPIDVEVNPGRINEATPYMNINQLRSMVIQTVPMGFRGAGRRVYTGVTQLMSFMSLNMGAHIEQHVKLMKDVFVGDEESARRHREFYDEYFAVLDMTAEFYLETVERIFLNNEIGRNQATYQGKPVDFGLITKTALMTIEGGTDEFCPVGQTAAAHTLCTSIPKQNHKNMVETDSGHYGVFSGSKYRNRIYPAIKNFITKHG